MCAACHTTLAQALAIALGSNFRLVLPARTSSNTSIIPCNAGQLGQMRCPCRSSQFEYDQTTLLYNLDKFDRGQLHWATIGCWKSKRISAVRLCPRTGNANISLYSVLQARPCMQVQYAESWLLAIRHKQDLARSAATSVPCSGRLVLLVPCRCPCLAATLGAITGDY